MIFLYKINERLFFMRKRMIPAVLTAAAAISVSALGAAAAEGENLVVLGDSIATGYGLEGYVSGDNTSAAGSFANRLSADYTGYENLAVDGRTSAQLLAALSEEETASALENADDIVISIGGNDLLQPLITGMQMSLMSDPEFMQGITDGTLTEEDITQKMSETSIEEMVETAAASIDLSATGDNISNIFSGINEINPDCDIYILTVYDPYDGEAEMSVASDMISELNDTIISSASSYDNVTVVDVYSSFKGNAVGYTNISEMDIHPNKAGHEVIYDLLKDTYIPQNDQSEEQPSESADETVSQPEDGYDTELLKSDTAFTPAPDSADSSPASGNTSDGVYLGLMAAAFGVMLLMKKGSEK